jgi:hypothetical protein
LSKIDDEPDSDWEEDPFESDYESAAEDLDVAPVHHPPSQQEERPVDPEMEDDEDDDVLDEVQVLVNIDFLML